MKTQSEGSMSRPAISPPNEVAVEMILRWDERELMSRISRAITSDPFDGLHQKDNGNWVLCPSADWLARLQDGNLVLTSKLSEPAKLQALAEFCRRWIVAR